MEPNQIAKVALSAATYAIDKPYDYLIPPELLADIQVGMRVMVPFGAGNRRAEGLILAIAPTPTTDKPLKALVSLLDDAPVLDSWGIGLVLWMRERFFCTVYDGAKAMLPAGLWFSLRDSYAIVPGIDRPESYEKAGQSGYAKRILDLIWASGGQAERSAIHSAFEEKNPKPALKSLVDQGVLQIETEASRGVGDKKEQVATLILPVEEALAIVAPKRYTAPLRYNVVELLCGIGSASTKELCYFTGASINTIRGLAKKGVISIEKREVLRRVAQKKVLPALRPTLNQEQQLAFAEMNRLAVAQEPAVALLYGVTGSGKTQVYISLIYEALGRGESAMVLVPEIALTPQLLNIFTAHFGEEVAVLHSGLRAGERYDEWKRIRSGKAKVVVGTRSAVFAPLQKLGVLILDEEQEGSYQSENSPRYHAREVAKYRCAKENGLLVLGSATPSIETMYLARTGVYHQVNLSRRYNQQALPPVYITDMKDELRQGNGTSISSDLSREISINLERGEQSILFLNRRGSNRMVTCGECGEVPTCPRCSVHLTYHSANGRLMCHYCGHSQPLPKACPHCGGGLNFLGIGTQRVQEDLEDLFPGVEVLRMDADTISATQSHQVLLDRFKKDKIPILIGTQMVAKGLDFEDVTLVGVIAADLGLYVDSFRGAERTFSLLTQVVGRAGRGAKGGRAVIQTYTPDNEVIRYAAAQDYDSFFQQELDVRRLMGHPPFRDVFVVTASGLDEGAVLRCCMRLRQGFEAWLSRPDFQGVQAKLLGPAQAPVLKVNNRYRYRITLCCKNNKAVRAMLAYILAAAHRDKENKGVSLYVGVNPYD